MRLSLFCLSHDKIIIISASKKFKTKTFELIFLSVYILIIKFLFKLIFKNKLKFISKNLFI